GALATGGSQPRRASCLFNFRRGRGFSAPLRNHMTGQELLASLGKLFGAKLQNETEFRGETTYTILPSDLREVAKFSRDELSFDYLIDITSIDNFGEEPRFEIVDAGNVDQIIEREDRKSTRLNSSH